MNRPRLWAEIDLSAIGHNIARLRSLLDQSTRFMLVVKADAYGLGAVPVARFAAAQGVEAFGVSNSEEALELRQAGIDRKVLILGAIVPGEAPLVVAHGIDVCVHTQERAQLLEAEAARQGRLVGIHIMVDTGMGRLGVRPESVLPLACDVRACAHLRLEGLATHIAGIGPSDLEADREQLRLFESVRRRLVSRVGERSADGEPLLVHVANSRAIAHGLGTRYNMVRPGLSAFGVIPDDAPGPELRPVLTLRTQISYHRDHLPGEPTGYGRLHRSQALERIATLPIGYDDGLFHRLSNRGRVLIRGMAAPIVGAISMDYTTIDVSHVANAGPNDTVTVIGRDGDLEITVAEVARLAETIPYEVMCSLGKRVQRSYVRDNTAARSRAFP